MAILWNFMILHTNRFLMKWCQYKAIFKTCKRDMSTISYKWVMHLFSYWDLWVCPHHYLTFLSPIPFDIEIRNGHHTDTKKERETQLNTWLYTSANSYFFFFLFFYDEEPWTLLRLIISKIPDIQYHSLTLSFIWWYSFLCLLLIPSNI